MIPEIREFFNNELLAGLASRNIIRLLFVCYEKHGEIRFAEITKALSASEKARLNDIFSQKMQIKKDRAEIEKDIITSIGNFQKKMALNRNKLLNQDIAVAEREKNFKKVEQLMKQKNALIKTRAGCFREEHIEKET